MSKYNLYKQLPVVCTYTFYASLPLPAGVLINGVMLKTKIVPKVLIN